MTIQPLPSQGIVGFSLIQNPTNPLDFYDLGKNDLVFQKLPYFQPSQTEYRSVTFSI